MYRYERPKAPTSSAAAPLTIVKTLIAKAQRLGTKGRDPEAFYLQKEEIIMDLRKIEHALENGN